MAAQFGPFEKQNDPYAEHESLVDWAKVFAKRKANGDPNVTHARHCNEAYDITLRYQTPIYHRNEKTRRYSQSPQSPEKAEGGIIIDPVFFKTGIADIHQRGAELCNQVATMLKRGSTVELELLRPDENNLALYQSTKATWGSQRHNYKTAITDPETGAALIQALIGAGLRNIDSFDSAATDIMAAGDKTYQAHRIRYGL